ncbi:uncharacterized protein LOC133300087, partial [Gastrolobium bilobum]
SATAANYVAQMNMLPMLNGANFKLWKENVEIVLGCMDLDNALRTEKSTSTQKNPNTDKIEKWERSNRMCLMIMKRSVPEAFRGSIIETTDAKLFLKELEQYFARNEKAEIGQTLSKLINMRVACGVDRQVMLRDTSLWAMARSSLIDNLYMFDTVSTDNEILHSSANGTKRKLKENSAIL